MKVTRKTGMIWQAKRKERVFITLTKECGLEYTKVMKKDGLATGADKHFEEQFLEIMDQVTGKPLGIPDVPPHGDRKTLHTVMRRLVRQLVMSILFGYTGIPALFRSTKHYGLFLLIVFIVSVVLTFTLNWWYLLLLSGFLWFVDSLTMVVRIVTFARGLRYSRRLDERESDCNGEQA